MSDRPTEPPRLELLPAVDVVDGRAVQLVQGVAGTGGEFGDPLEAALAWQEQGAEWLHLVDLDAAFGRGSNAELLSGIVGRLDIRVEMSGGIRDAETLERALATGCRRVNLGTAALEHPEWTARAIAEHGDRVAVGLDVRGTTLAARGWTREGGDLWQTLARLDAEGCARYVVTDVAKDGMLQGPNLGLLREVCARTDRPVVASGGVSTLDDVAAIRDLAGEGVEGAIIGSALYRGAFTLPEALDVAGRAVSGTAGSPTVPPGDDRHQPGGATDSADVPWAGRQLSPTGFEADTGEADRALLDALATPSDDVALMRAVEAARFVVPIVTEPTEVDTSGEHAVDKQVDLAAVTLVAPDGRRALPVFSGLEALAAWDNAARPVPVTPARVGQAAVVEGCDVVVVDVAGPVTRVLRSSMVWALAQQRPWEPAHTDAFVAGSVATAVRGEEDVLGHELEEGTPSGEGVLGVVLDLRPGLGVEEVRELVTRLGERLATDGELRARIDGLAFRLR